MTYLGPTSLYLTQKDRPEEALPRPDTLRTELAGSLWFLPGNSVLRWTLHPPQGATLATAHLLSTSTWGFGLCINGGGWLDRSLQMPPRADIFMKLSFK